MRTLAALALASSLTATVVTGPEGRWARPLHVSEPGPARAAVDVPLLVEAARHGADARRGLDALRLHDAEGREVPYLLVEHEPARPEWFADLGIVPTPQTRDTSGFQAEMPPVRVDRIRIRGLPSPLLKRLRVEGSGDGERWVVLEEDGTLFDLPEEGLRRLELDVPQGVYRYVRVTWFDLKSSRVPLPSELEARAAARPGPPPPLTADVAFERRPSEPGTSRFRIALPAPRLPVAALALDCRGGHLLRPATVTEARLQGSEVSPLALGRATLRRVVWDDAAASDLRIELSGVDGPELDLTVDDGDNPPLELASVSMEMEPLPWIYLETGAEGTLTASFASPGSPAPRYDLEALRDRVDASDTAPASWGEPSRGSVGPETGPAPATYTSGPPLDRRGFRFARPVDTAHVPPGAIAALRLDAAVLANAQPDLSDLRLVDAAGGQVPYLLESLAEPLQIDLPEPEPVPPPEETRPGVSWYRIPLPEAGLPASRLLLRTSARVFERSVAVVVMRAPSDGRGGARPLTLSSQTWSHDDPERAAPELAVGLPELPERVLLIRVEEGDNEPLPLLPARLLLPARRLRFFAPRAAPPTLLYGNRAVGPPRYDLALLAPRLVGAATREVVPGPPEPLPTPPDVHATGRSIFWGALVVAVVVLLVLIARLVKEPPPTDGELSR